MFLPLFTKYNWYVVYFVYVTVIFFCLLYHPQRRDSRQGSEEVGNEASCLADCLIKQPRYWFSWPLLASCLLLSDWLRPTIPLSEMTQMSSPHKGTDTRVPDTAAPFVLPLHLKPCAFCLKLQRCSNTPYCTLMSLRHHFCKDFIGHKYMHQNSWSLTGLLKQALCQHVCCVSVYRLICGYAEV